jgi:hypothetical protein
MANGLVLLDGTAVWRMAGAYRTLAAVGLLAFTQPAWAGERIADPLRFWVGKTETVGTLKIIMKKPFKTRSVGRGEMRPDGSLDLIQRVEDEGEAPRERRWRIRKTGPKRYVGTMTEAIGPVIIEEVDGRYRFRFKMKGNLSVEQWIMPNADGKSGRNKVTIKKLGMTVGHSEGTVRKLD